MRDAVTGYVLHPEFPCYQDAEKLCRLRELPDSKMECAFDAKTCSHCKPKKEKNDKSSV